MTIGDRGGDAVPREMPRIGTGVDIHPFATDRSMRLAGLHWPDEPNGLAGEPDGDVVVHAACNALLTAANLGDLGTHFDTSTEEWQDAAPIVLLTETARLVSEAGFEVGNISIQLVGERPTRYSRACGNRPHHDEHRRTSARLWQGTFI